MITSFGLNAHTIVSNTNSSASTEEGIGFGAAMLDFLNELAARKEVPQVLSLSLGSLSAYSCELLCDKAQDQGDDPIISRTRVRVSIRVRLKFKVTIP